MNNIESMVSTLQKMRGDIEAYSESLNASLRACNLKTIDTQYILKNIDAQIESAQSKFTIAFVGTFKTGKSTIINSLLELTGDERLSSEYDPDTAKCVRLVYKDRGSPEAEIEFFDSYEEEQLNWAEAKKYTSQVELDKADEQFRNKAAKIREVRYYVKHELLKHCNILDLPGTGTGNYIEHTDITDEKILETDCFFWVVTTDSEPDMETLLNLEKIRHKLLPIINVWQIEEENIGMESDRITPEEILGILQKNYSAYMLNSEDPVIYYAGEIDYAQRHGYEIKPEWGKAHFVEKVMDLLGNIQEGDRAERIRNNLLRALEQCTGLLVDLQNSQGLKTQERQNKEESREAKDLRSKFERGRRKLKADIQAHAAQKTEEVLERLSGATESFISIKMDGMDLRALVKGKKRYADELRREYEKSYICLENGWLDACGEGFLEEVKTLVCSYYADFEYEIDFGDPKDQFDVSSISLSEFAESMAGSLQKDALDKLLPALVSSVVTIIGVFVPGEVILDVLSGLFAGKKMIDLSDNSKITARAKMIAYSCKVRIRQQKYVVLREFASMGEKIANSMESEISKKLDKRSDEVKQRGAALTSIRQTIESFADNLEMQEREIRALFSVKG